MLPRITVVLFTYTPSLDHPRRAYAWDTWRALAANLRYEGPFRWHIADDGSPPEHVVALRDGEALEAETVVQSADSSATQSS